MLRPPGWAWAEADGLRAPPSATPPPTTGDLDFQPRLIERRTRMRLRPASPAEALRAQAKALAGPYRTPDRLPSRSSQSRAAVGRQRISGPQSRHNESNSDPGLGRPAEPGCFAADRARPSIRTLRVRPPGSRRPPCPLQRASGVSRRCTGSSAGHDDRLRRGAAQRVGGSGVHLSRLLHR